MVLQSGSTTLTIAVDAWSNPDPEVEIDTNTSSAGNFKLQIAGERYIGQVSAVMTGTEYRTFLDIINDNNNDIYYTPTEVAPEYTATDFPMLVVIEGHSKEEKASSNAEIVYYVTFPVRSAEYM